MWEMDRQSPEQKQTVGSKTITATSAAVAMATVSSSFSSSCSSSQCTRAPSLSIIPTDRQTVQLVQHAAIYRPQSSAAQYLHQVYAAQQQHFLLQTAALQQHPSRLQTLATLQQASVCQRPPPDSSSSSLANSTGVPPKTITLPASPVAARPIGQSQASTAVNAISQKAILLRKTPTNFNEAQMYLRTKMLILTPAVQSDPPSVTFCSSLPTSSQVKNLVLQSPFPGALATAHSIVLKPSPQTQTLSAASSLSKTTIIDLKTNQQTEASAETEPPDVTQSVSDPQIIIPECSPIPSSTPVEQQSPIPPDQQLKPQQTGAAPIHLHLQPISLRAETKDTTSDSSSVKNEPPASSSSSIHASVSTAQSEPPPLVAAQRRTSLPLVQNQPPPSPLILSKLPKCHPTSLHRPFLRSIQALAVRPGEVEQPVVKALVQMPLLCLAPPQTVAVDLKMNPIRNHETPEMELVENRANLEKNYSKTPTHQTHSPRENDAEDSSSVIRTQLVELSQIPSRNSPPPPSPSSSPTLPAAEVSNQLPSAPAGLPGCPDRTAHIITHLVDGFVIQEALEPFPRQKVKSSLSSAAQQASLPESQEVQTNRNATENSPLDADQSDSPEMENGSAADVAEIRKSVLQCECCGGKSPTHTRLHSKSFCSTMCVKRFSVRFRKRGTVLRAGRWAQRSEVGRPRKHFLRQAQVSFRSDKPQQSSRREEVDQQEEEEPLVPMTTRLRKQAERQHERETEQRKTDIIIISDGEEENDNARPSQWDVEKVFSFISALPGGAEVAERFHSQEIDGQALLLLTEDHLVSTMNFKLGPALKLCAHINSLKEA